MKTWSKSKMAITALLGLVLILVLWVKNQYQYKALAAYKCNKWGERVIPGPSAGFQDMMELYVGGWIERGEVTISGLPSRENEVLTFSRGLSVRTISHAYIGEWYGPDIRIVFEPAPESSCLIRVNYKYK